MVSNDHELEEYYREFTSRVDCTPMEKAAADGTRRTLAQTLAIRNAMRREGCACASLSCWPSSSIWKGTPCIAIGELASQGYQISCEGDVYGAITLEMLSACSLVKIRHSLPTSPFGILKTTTPSPLALRSVPVRT